MEFLRLDQLNQNYQHSNAWSLLVNNANEMHAMAKETSLCNMNAVEGIQSHSNLVFSRGKATKQAREERRIVNRLLSHLDSSEWR